MLLRIGRNTRDLDRATAFYCHALGFRVDEAGAAASLPTGLPFASDSPTRSARLSLGRQALELTEFPEAAPYPQHSSSCDLGFQHCAIVVSDMRAAHARVLRHAFTPITRRGPQTLPPSTGAVQAFKFRDPDGHPLELIHFPRGTGDPAWHAVRGGDAPTLGIDHVAISISDLERSVRFYALLGFHVTQRGVNHGIAQQRLDDLAHVEVDVVALQAAQAHPPHLELLHYRRPRGRAAPCADATAIAADRPLWRADAVDALLDALASAGFTEAIVAKGGRGRTTTALLRDPDGHFLGLTGTLA